MTQVELKYEADAERWRGFINQLRNINLPYTSTVEFGQLKCSVADQHVKYITWLESEVNKIEP